MLTRKSLNELLDAVITELKDTGIAPTKIILFGSYPNGGVHKYSDIDVAVWSEKFAGDPIADFELVRNVSAKHRPVSFRLYPAYATSLNYDPFIEVIEQTGICIYEQEKQTR